MVLLPILKTRKLLRRGAYVIGAAVWIVAESLTTFSYLDDTLSAWGEIAFSILVILF